MKMGITGQSILMLCDGKCAIEQTSPKTFLFICFVLFSKDLFSVLPFNEWACLFAVLCLKCKGFRELDLYHFKCHCYFCVICSILLCIPYKSLKKGQVCFYMQDFCLTRPPTMILHQLYKRRYIHMFIPMHFK